MNHMTKKRTTPKMASPCRARSRTAITGGDDTELYEEFLLLLLLLLLFSCVGERRFGVRADQ